MKLNETSLKGVYFKINMVQFASSLSTCPFSLDQLYKGSPFQLYQVTGLSWNLHREPNFFTLTYLMELQIKLCTSWSLHTPHRKLRHLGLITEEIIKCIKQKGSKITRDSPLVTTIIAEVASVWECTSNYVSRWNRLSLQVWRVYSSFSQQSLTPSPMSLADVISFQ